MWKNKFHLLTVVFVAGKQVMIAFEVRTTVELVRRFANQHLLNILNAVDHHCRLIAKPQTDNRAEAFAQRTERLVW